MKLIADRFPGGLSQTPSSQAATPTGKQESHSSNVGSKHSNDIWQFKKVGREGFSAESQRAPERGARFLV